MSRSTHHIRQMQLHQQQIMAENDSAALATEIFDHFCAAITMRQVLGLYRNMCDTIGLRAGPLNDFYPKLKAKVRSWKAQALWKKFDGRAAHRAYSKGTACTGTRVLVIGAGPCGLRTAIEAQLLGAKVVVVEKRDRISRNNVLHLWPFVITDLRNLGAKKFYGKFCAGSIDHISIRQLQCILLKVALLLGVEVHEGVSFEKTLEPSDGCGWRAEVTPEDHAVSHYEFDVLIGADGKRNTLEGFRRKEFRGKLAIAITANFINKKTEAEAKAEEISGVAFIFNQSFFKELYQTTGIDLENIVYYKDETHYFVMTAKKHSLIDKGVIIQDFADPAELLSSANVNTEKLLDYAREAAGFSTKYQMPNLEFAVNHYGKPDVAMFDFTSMFAAETSCRVIVRKNYRLLQCLVGDSLLEPFWPTGSGCARGFLSSMDAAYAIKLWTNTRNSILGVLAQRESIYRLLAQTTPENLQRDIGAYTVDPATRYPNLNRSTVNVWQVKHLLDADDQMLFEQTFMDTNIVQANAPETPIRRKRRTGDTLPLSTVLLRWIKAQLHSNEFTQDLNDVSDCFTGGKVLCTLINRYRPDLVDLNSLKDCGSKERNELAFKILETELGIPRVMTANDSVNLENVDSKIWLNYLEQICEVFRGEIPHVKHPKLDFSELKERTSSSNAPDFSRLLKLNTKKAKSPMQDIDMTQVVHRRSILDEEKIRRQRKAVPDFTPVQVDTSRRAKKRRSHEKSGNIEERQQRLKEIETNRQDRQSKRRLQRFQQTQNFYKSLHMLQANTLLRESDSSSPFEDYSIYMYRQQAPEFNDRVKDLERKLLYPDRERGIPSAMSRGGATDEQFSDRIKSMEQRITSRNAGATDKKPKDLLRAIGKIESTDWNIREIEKKIEQSKKTEIGKSKEKVPKWSKEQFLARQNKMSKADRQDSTEEKFKDIDQTLKNFDKHLKEGSVLEVGQRGRNKVASIAGQFGKKGDHTDEKSLPVQKSNSKVGLVFNKQGASEKCHFCKQTVYLMEKISTEGLILHRSCLKCHHCHTNLRLGGYAFDRDDPVGRFYCTQHFRLPAKAIRPIVRKSMKNQKKQAEPAKPDHIEEQFKTPERPRGRPENIAQLDLLDRGQTPERIEFENVDAMSDGEPSQEHIIDENEWTDRNFITESEDTESNISSTDSSDEDSESDYEEANGSPLGVQTLQLATDWIGKQRYSHMHDDSDGDFYDSSEDDDDADSQTEGEEFKKARELRRQEVKVQPPPAYLPTDTETEVVSKDVNPHLNSINSDNKNLSDKRDANAINDKNLDNNDNDISIRPKHELVRGELHSGSVSDTVLLKPEIKRLENSGVRRISTEIDALNENVYNLNNLIKLQKDVDNLKRESVVKNDIMKKLSLKEKWLSENSCSGFVPSLKPVMINDVASMVESVVDEAKIEDVKVEGIEVKGTKVDDKKGEDRNVEHKKVEQKKVEDMKVEHKKVEDVSEKHIPCELPKDPEELEIEKLVIEAMIESKDDDIKKEVIESGEQDLGKMFYKLENSERRMSKTLKNIEVKNFSDTMDSIKSQMSSPKISKQSSCDLSKYFPNQKAEKSVSLATNKNQKSLKEVDVSKYFSQSPEIARKESSTQSAKKKPNLGASPKNVKRSISSALFGPASDSKPSFMSRPVAKQNILSHQPAGYLRPKLEFDDQLDQLDGAIDLKPAKPVRKDNLKVPASVKARPSKKTSKNVEGAQALDPDDKIFEDILQENCTTRPSSTEYRRLFEEEKSPSEDISEKIEKMFEGAIKIPAKSPKINSRKKKMIKTKTADDESKRSKIATSEEDLAPNNTRPIHDCTEALTDLEKTMEFLKEGWKTEATSFLQNKRDSFYTKKKNGFSEEPKTTSFLRKPSQTVEVPKKPSEKVEVPKKTSSAEKTGASKKIIRQEKTKKTPDKEKPKKDKPTTTTVKKMIIVEEPKTEVQDLDNFEFDATDVDDTEFDKILNEIIEDLDNEKDVKISNNPLPDIVQSRKGVILEPDSLNYKEDVPLLQHSTHNLNGEVATVQQVEFYDKLPGRSYSIEFPNLAKKCEMQNQLSSDSTGDNSRENAELESQTADVNFSESDHGENSIQKFEAEQMLSTEDGGKVDELSKVLAEYNEKDSNEIRNLEREYPEIFAAETSSGSLSLNFSYSSTDDSRQITPAVDLSKEEPNNQTKPNESFEDWEAMHSTQSVEEQQENDFRHQKSKDLNKQNECFDHSEPIHPNSSMEEEKEEKEKCSTPSKHSPIVPREKTASSEEDSIEALFSQLTDDMLVGVEFDSSDELIRIIPRGTLTPVETFETGKISEDRQSNLDLTQEIGKEITSSPVKYLEIVQNEGSPQKHFPVKPVRRNKSISSSSTPEMPIVPARVRKVTLPKLNPVDMAPSVQEIMQIIEKEHKPVERVKKRSGTFPARVNDEFEEEEIRIESEVINKGGKQNVEIIQENNFTGHLNNLPEKEPTDLECKVDLSNKNWDDIYAETAKAESAYIEQLEQDRRAALRKRDQMYAQQNTNVVMPTEIPQPPKRQSPLSDFRRTSESPKLGLSIPASLTSSTDSTLNSSTTDSTSIPHRPHRRKSLSQTHDETVDHGTKILLERSKMLHNMKQEFINEKIVGNNPYLKKMIDEEKRSQEDLNRDADENDELATVELRNPRRHHLFPTSRSITSDRQRHGSSESTDRNRRTHTLASTLGPRNFVEYFKRSPSQPKEREPSKDNCVVQTDSESSSPDDVNLNSATEISTDSEFDHDPIFREAPPRIFIDDTHLRKPTRVQVRQGVIANNPSQKLSSVIHHQNQAVFKAPEIEFKPLVQVDPSLLNSNRMPLKNPRAGDYLLTKAPSTEGIASRKSLELKKRYLLGEQGIGNGIMKSGSTSILDTKLKSFHSNISECQKLLNPSGEISPSMKTFLDRTKVVVKDTNNILDSEKKSSDEKENVFVNNQNALNKGKEYSETVNTTLVENLSKGVGKLISPIIETIDLISPEKTIPIIDLTETPSPDAKSSSDKRRESIVDLTSEILPEKKDDLDATLVPEKPDVSKDVKEKIPDIITHVEETKVEKLIIEDESNDINDTCIEVPTIPWIIKNQEKSDVELDSLSNSSTSSLDDIPHFILDSTTSPETQNGIEQIVPRLEVHDTTGTLMQIDSLMIIDGKYVGDLEDLKHMEIPKGVEVPETKPVEENLMSSTPKPDLKFDTKNENKIDTLKNIPLILEKDESQKPLKPTSLGLSKSKSESYVDKDKTPTAETIVSDSETEMTGQALTETELSDWTADDAVSENFVDIEFVLNSNRGTIKRNKKSRKKTISPKKNSQKIIENTILESRIEENATLNPLTDCSILKNLNIDEIEFMDTGSEGSCAEAYSATNRAMLHNRGYIQFIEHAQPNSHPPKNCDLNYKRSEIYHPTEMPKEVEGIDYIEQGACILNNELDLKTPVNEVTNVFAKPTDQVVSNQQPPENVNDIDDDSLVYITSQGTVTGTTTTEESDALTVVVSPLDISRRAIEEPSSSDKNEKTTSISSAASKIPIRKTSDESRRRQSNEDLLNSIIMKKRDSEDLSYEEYVRKLQLKITQISNARDSIDIRKQRRKSSKGDVSEATQNNSVIESKNLSIFDPSLDPIPQLWAPIANQASFKKQDVSEEPFVPAVTKKLEEITKERTKQKDLIHDLVMDKLQSKKQLNAEKRLNRSRNRSLFASGTSGTPSPPPKITANYCSNSPHYHVASAERRNSKSSPSIIDETDNKPVVSASPSKAVIKDELALSKERPLSDNLERVGTILGYTPKITKTQSFCVYSTRFLPLKDDIAKSNPYKPANTFVTPHPPPRPFSKPDDGTVSTNTDKLRAEARARARLKSNEDLGLSPEEKLKLLRKRYHLDMQQALETGEKSLPSPLLPPLSTNKSDDMKVRERKMVTSKSFNDITAVQGLLNSDENFNTKSPMQLSDFTSDPNLTKSDEKPQKATCRRRKDPERRKSLIQAVSSFFHKKKEKDGSPSSPTPTKDKSDGVFSRFKISPKATKEKSKDRDESSCERSKSHDCLKHEMPSHSSSPQLFKRSDDVVPPPIPPLPLNYQRSDDESYTTESRDQKKQRAISKATRQAELKRLRIAQEIQREQEEIEVKLKELEARGVLIEKALRGEGQDMENLETSSMGASDEKLLKELLEIWRNITQLKKRDEELGIRQRELQLEHRHAQLKDELNNRLSCSKLEKSSADVAAEGAILNEMLEIVAKRAALRPNESTSLLRQSSENNSDI